ncbi:MAG: hypothetical protein N3C57_00380 [Aquificaceae bacterium]|nr:hypothetical protein [Aquificaceae bacterium]
MKKELLAAILTVGSLGTLAGCGGGAGSVSTDAGSTTSSVSPAEKASVVVSAKFPETNGVETAFIDERIDSITIYIGAGCSSTECSAWRSVTLTRTNPRAVIDGLPAGNFLYEIIGKSGQTVLDYLNGAGRLVAGTNNLTATLIRARWTLVDANNNPITLSLNKTKSDSQERITGFIVLPYQSEHYPMKLERASIQNNAPYGFDFHTIYYLGSNLTAIGCASAGTYCRSYGHGLVYVNQFVGPSTNINAIAEGQINLIPDPEYSQTYDSTPSTCWRYGDPYDCSNRALIILGLPPGFSDYDSDVIEYRFTMKDSTGTDITNAVVEHIRQNGARVTSANTMQGIMLEILTKNETERIRCYDVNRVTCPNATQPCEVNCPPYITLSQKVSNVKTSLSRALSKTVDKQGLSKAQTQIRDCYRSAVIEEREVWRTSAYLNNDYIPDPINVETTRSETIDACFHNFRARANQITSQDLQSIGLSQAAVVQNLRKALFGR